MTMNIGEPPVDTIMPDGKPGMINTQLVQNLSLIHI